MARSPLGVVLAVLAIIVAVLLIFVLAPKAFAGNPHFVGAPTVTVDDGVLAVDGKVAGLGNEEQIHVTVDALAECQNRGGNKPAADNKDEVSVAGDFPVQNGKALFDLELDGAAQIDPPCEPPMTVVYSDVTVTVDVGDADAVLVYEAAGLFR